MQTPAAESAIHPGPFIRKEVIPAGMSVTKAAQLIGVGRPALSNLLNGKASLSGDMATRLEKAFGYPRKKLMEVQAKHDEAQTGSKSAPSNTKAYVPPFLTIKANDIEQWASHNIQARSRLSVFIRTLAHSTGGSLAKVDFPGNDDSERPGWDGYIEATEGTPWVPVGRSGWEFGTNKNIKKKADSDFDKSVKALGKDERGDMTFVFVTPRRWQGKTAWINSKKSAGLWKNIRVYDASDLEQWLEQSLPAQAWFANESKLPSEGVRSLDKCWTDWANVADPPLSGELFTSAIDAAKGTMLSRLTSSSIGPIIIAADSTEEALAFVAQLFAERGGEELESFRDRVLVFDQPGVLPRLSAGAQSFIPVVSSREVEREMVQLGKSVPSIVVYPRNAITCEPHIALEPANSNTFTAALEDMGKDRDEISRLTNESGRSLTVLRRRLANIPAVQTPEWADASETARSLVPFLLVGAWHSENEIDQFGLEYLAGNRTYDELEKDCQNLARLNDAPIWSIGAFRGVISKIDLLYAIAYALTPADLKRYYEMARLVLGEDDPALDLPDDQRWAASIHGKIREFSRSFREGISETLVLLAVHGGYLFKSRLGIDTESAISSVIRELLPTPLTTRVLEANDHDLPTYAEAAPDEFLTILERDLKRDEPALLGLMRPVDTGLFGGTSVRTGLLWALEGLSWDPITLPRAVAILARLAQVEINDNLANKPINSLESIFRSWMPQTAADHEVRVSIMRKLARTFPDVAWKLCVAQFGVDNQIGNHNHKPRWRTDGYGFGQPYETWGPVTAFVREMVELALSRKHYSLPMLSDLVERLHGLSDDDQNRVWHLVEVWARSEASDEDKATLREKIRRSALSRRAAIRAKREKSGSELTTAAKTAYDSLEPKDILNKHAWLFRSSWVEESADELDDIENMDFEKRQARIENLRVEALADVKNQRGVAGLVDLACIGNASWIIGGLAAKRVLRKDELQQLLKVAFQSILDNHDDGQQQKSLISGALLAVTENNERNVILKTILAYLPNDKSAKLLALAPFGKSTWTLVDVQDQEVQAEYWREVIPDWIHHSDEENKEGIQRLMKAGRPRAAFACARFCPEKIEAELLYQLLLDISQGGNDKSGQYMLEHYQIGKALEHINSCSNLNLEQKATLEFTYIDLLARPWERNEVSCIPNLEQYIENNPEFFVRAIVWTYKRNDNATDPEEYQVPADRTKLLAELSYKFLESIKRIPGSNAHGNFDLARLTSWINAVRRMGSNLARADIVDLCLGKILSHAPVGSDGVWPCEAVRDVMEEVQSEHIMSGAHTGIYNSRGAHFRGEGGDPERELAEKYRTWGEAILSSHPFVASKLLLELCRTYEREADREDTDARVRRRLG